jgi:glycosyltransferase involved in cell wall biosynthesis
MITIGVVTYNRPDFLRECVVSILSQSYTDWNLIISNDYILKDVTFEDLKILPDNRIRIINRERNLGEIANLNFLLNLATTRFFTWLCDDDMFHENFLEEAIAAFEDNVDKNVVSFYSNYATGLTYDIHEKLKNKSKKINPTSFKSVEFSKKYLSKKIPLIGCYGVMKTDALKMAGGFKVLGNSFSPYSDTLLPISLSQFGEILYTPSRLVFLRTHELSVSSTSPNFSGYITAEEDFLKELILLSEANPHSINKNECIGLACIWFSDNHFTVLMRKKNKNTISVYIIYIMHQINISFPHLNWYWKLRLIIHMILFCMNNLAQSIRRRIYHLKLI